MSAGGLSGVDLAMPLGGIALEIFGNKSFPNFPPSALNRTLRSLLSRAGPGPISHFSRCGDITLVERSGNVLTGVHFSACPPLVARVFLDCSYEGDLLRLSNTSFVVGREAAAEFNESLGGVNGGQPWGAGAFPGVSPWADAANTTLLPTVFSLVPAGTPPTSGDGAVQAMNYRLCLTNNASNRLPFSAPSGYNPAATEVLRRYFKANAARLSNATLLSLFLVRELGESKIDVNDKELLPNTADLPFLQVAYPLANWSTRAAIAAQHEWYIRAAWEFLRNDAAVPPAIRAEAAQWGLAADEFVSTGGFPPQLYVREALRLRGVVVMAQRDVFGAATSAKSSESVGLSKWLVDIHKCSTWQRRPPSLGYGEGSALFEDCALEIFDTVTAHRGNGSSAYLFDRCLVRPPQARTLLGRPWGPNATVVFKSCAMSDNIDPAGWGDWQRGCTNRTNPGACAFVTYAEYNSTREGTGLPVNVSERVWWSKQLVAAQAAGWDAARVLGDWKPVRPPRQAWMANLLAN